MKFFAVFLIVALFAIRTEAEQNSFCMICGDIPVPEDWPTAQYFLSIGCTQLGAAKAACQNLVKAADLTESYPAMFPHIVKLRELGCAKYCPK